MSDYDLLDKIMVVLNKLESYTNDEREELLDISKDHLSNDEMKLFKKYINTSDFFVNPEYINNSYTFHIVINSNDYLDRVRKIKNKLVEDFNFIDIQSIELVSGHHEVKITTKKKIEFSYIQQLLK